ncbi:MAG: amidohydrolase family protein [Cyclobacteriaceae bacterium]|nr:amidohydrolase family protein [Cyclobacteriaceae bacterium]
MVKQLLLLLIIFCCVACSTKHNSTTISNVRIINVGNGNVGPLVDIHSVDGVITKIAEHDPDVSGGDQHGFDSAFVIPGLWDMHAHPDDPEVWRMSPTRESRDKMIPQFVLNGVLGIRDMGGSLDEIKRWRTMRREGQLVVPEIVAAGPLLDGPNPMWDGSVGIASPDVANQVVDSLLSEGVDFLKIYSLLPRETYFAIAKYANDIHVPFAGHVPYTVTPTEAARSGMKSQEHLLEILKECSDYDSLVTSKVFDPTKYKGVEKYVATNEFMLSRFDTTKFISLLNAFKETNTWICPTVSMWYKNAWFEKERVSDDSLWQYLPSYLKRYWTTDENDHLKNRDNVAFIEVKKKLVKLYGYMIKEMAERDIPLLSGTDTGANPLCWPGVGVVNEVVMLNEIGVSRLKALQSATINPVEFLGLDSLGDVSVGKKADMLILKSNPLDNLNALRDIRGIFHDNKFYNTEERRRLLELTKSF